MIERCPSQRIPLWTTQHLLSDPASVLAISYNNKVFPVPAFPSMRLLIKNFRHQSLHNENSKRLWGQIAHLFLKCSLVTGLLLIIRQRIKFPAKSTLKYFPVKIAFASYRIYILSSLFAVRIFIMDTFQISVRNKKYWHLSEYSACYASKYLIRFK